MLRHPYILGAPQTKGRKIRIGGHNPQPSQGPNRGRKCYVTHAFLGVPKTKGDKIQIGRLTPALPGAQKRAEMVGHPCILGGHQTKGDKIHIGCLTPALPEGGEAANCVVVPLCLGTLENPGVT